MFEFPLNAFKWFKLGIMDLVKPLSKEEEKLYQTIDFDQEEYRKDIGTPKLVHQEKVSVRIKQFLFGDGNTVTRNNK